MGAGYDCGHPVNMESDALHFWVSLACQAARVLCVKQPYRKDGRDESNRSIDDNASCRAVR